MSEMSLEKIRARGCDGLYRSLDSKTIYLRKFRKGRREIKISLRTQDIEEAKSKRDEILKKWDDKAARYMAAKKQAKTALELFDVWITRKETMNRAAATIDSMKFTRSFLKSHLETMAPEDITAEWWETIYIKETRAKSRKNRKFFNDRKWLLGFLRQLQEDGLLATIPKLLNPDSRESVGKVFSDQEVMDLLNFAPTEDLHLAILMAATMGLRRSEIFGLSIARVDIEKRLIILRKQDTKTRQARTFSISPAAFPLLEKRVKDGGAWIFPNRDNEAQDGYTSAWRRLKANQGITGRFHDLRHTFLTKAFKAAGANAAQICAYAGLSLVVAQKVYLHLTEEDSRRVGELVSYE